MRAIHLSALTFGVLITLNSPASSLSPSDPPDSASAPLLVLPFKNLSSSAQSKDAVMPVVYAHLRQAGFNLVEAENVEASLRRHRIRDTGQLSKIDAQHMQQDLESSWALLGAIEIYDQQAVEVGFSARLLKVQTGEIVWAEGRYARGEDYAGLLGLGEIQHLEALVDLEIGSLLHSLQDWRRQHTEVWEMEDTALSPLPVIAIIPFENVTTWAIGDQLVNTILLTSLVQRGYRVVEPGMVKEELFQSGRGGQWGADHETLTSLADHLNVRYCLLGLLSQYQPVGQVSGGEIPQIEIEIRLVETLTHDLIWAHHLERSGSDYQTIFQLGEIRSAGRLLQISMGELLETLPRGVKPKESG